MSRSFSPESSSDSGNETNSSEMTEGSELAAAHKLSENALKMFVATADGYQTLAAEETEFRLTPCDSQSRNLRSEHFEMEPETMETKSLTEYFNKMHMDMMMGMKSDERDVEPRSAGEPEARQVAESHREEIVRRYNGFNARDSHRSSPFDHDRRSHVTLNTKADGHVYSEVAGDGGTSDRVTQKVKRGELDGSTLRGSPAKEQRGHQMRAAQAEYEYPLPKRMSSLQSEGVHSLQSSQCSSIDAGCCTGSSNSATPMDSPLCTADAVHAHAESSAKAAGYQSADAAFLRKQHGAAGAESTAGAAGRDGCQRVAKIKETTGITDLRFNKVL